MMFIPFVNITHPSRDLSLWWFFRSHCLRPKPCIFGLNWVKNENDGRPPESSRRLPFTIGLMVA